MFGRITTLTAALAVLAVPAFAQQAPDGAAAFNRACASCHRDGQTTAPTPAVLRQLTPEGVLNSITQGRMQAQGATLSAGERRAVAEYVAGRALATATTAVPNRCSASPAMTDAATSPGWNGWGNGATNTRFAPGGGLTAADLPRLKLKWAFGYSGVNAARAQPTIAGGRLFVASENGEAHALDPKTGCTLLDLPGAGGHSHRARRRSLQDARPARVRRSTSATCGPTPTRWTRRPVVNSGCARWTSIRRRRSPARRLSPAAACSCRCRG